MRLLVVEDNKKFVKYILNGLKSEGYSVDTAYDGSSALKMIYSTEYDLIVLDILLPGKDGVSICKDLRKNGNTTPVLMLTALGQIDDKVHALDIGADDYLVKPFELLELFARIRALIRRPAVKTLDIILTAGDITLNPSDQTVKVGDKEIEFTNKEFQILQYLLTLKGDIASREQILEHCWDIAYDSFANSVDVYIKRIRRKLDPNSLEKYIETVRGVGYKIKK